MKYPRGLSGKKAGWSPWDLLDHGAGEIDRDRAEGMRIAYVAATRARDLLVVPVLGDDPFDGSWAYADQGWVAPVQGAVYPAAAARQGPVEAAGCPRFGEDSVVERPAGESAGPRTVRPGRHAIGDSPDHGYDVVWWDPRTLKLDAPSVFGVRREDLIRETDPETVAATRRAYDDWRQDRDRASERAQQPSITLQTVGERAKQRQAGAEQVAGDVTIVDANLGIAKPGGRRFGTLVHAVLATVPLDATPEQIAEVTETQARIVAAPPEESDTARRMTQALLSHSFLIRAREAWKAGKCRREAPIAWVETDGVLVEGVLDLAFEDEGGWTIVDFKTNMERAALEQYRRQVGLYAAAVARATSRGARGVLILL